MKISYESYKDKVKACWIGKNIGGTMGTPYEGKRELLDVKGFASKPGEPLPNDDLDLQLIWLYALENIGPANITGEALGEFWLNFIPPHWNEYGIGKANMLRGLVPPTSGDWENDWKHSNGAWIRTEIWACTAPAIPELAVKYAVADAKVDHGTGEGTYAAAFVAAMQSSAFALDSLYQCIEAGLCAIPAESRVAKSVSKVLEYYKDGKSWVDARNAVLEMNSDIGNGWFEAPSNVAYAILGMVYGEGDFKKSMLIAINCGDDTDCTGATVGSTMGILYGTKGIPSDWAEYIGDKIITVSLINDGCGARVPKSCTELTERVIAIAPSVMYSHNGKNANRGNDKLMTVFGEPDTTAEQNLDTLKDRIKRYVPENVLCYGENAIEFAKGPFAGSLSVSSLNIEPFGEITVKLDIRLMSYLQPKQYPLKLNWLVPEGFTVDGPKNGFLKRYERHAHGTGHFKAEFTVTAPEYLNDTERLVLEITSPGRHTSIYVPVVLLP